MAQANDPQHLLTQAATCRRLALSTTDDEIRDRLIALAEEHEAKAAAADTKP